MSLLDYLDGIKAVSTLVGAAIGALVTTTVQKILAKTSHFRYSTNVQRVAVSADDAVFGSVRVTWGNNPVRNLYIAEVELENTTTRDFENVEFKVYTSNETFLLNERSAIEGTPYIANWSDDFKTAIVVATGATPSQDQSNMYYHSRDYHLKVFNRGQVIRLNYLCTKPNDDNPPAVFLNSQLKGAKFVRQNRRNLFYGVPNQIVLVRGLIISGVVVLACGRFLHSVWTSAIVSLIAGLVVLPLGFAGYSIERWIRKLIAG